MIKSAFRSISGFQEAGYSRGLFALSFLIVLSGCRKKPGAESVVSGDVYVSGGVASGGKTSATIWGNGVSATLPNNGADVIYSLGQSAAISGNTVYVAGYYEPANGDETPMLWQNGVGEALQTTGAVSRATAITVQGSDVYIAGGYIANSLDYACYWKNGIPTTLTDQGIYGAYATAIAVQGSTVYVAGFSYTQNSQTAVYWVNGVEYFLTDSNSVYSTATGIAVSGTDVYVLGWVQRYSVSTATYWLNGNPFHLSDTTLSTRASGITVDGGDIYVSGAGLNITGNPSFIVSSYLMYWKNNTLQNPADSSSSNASLTVGSIAVSGSNVYIAGTSNNQAVYWKNGVPVQLTNVNSVGMGIAVAP